MKFRFVIIAVCCFFTLAVRADEGMWMLGNLDKQTRRTMKELGLQMPADKLYSSRRPSLKDAVVSFGGFCSGVVVSEDGLVFTNHHCGFSCVQQHSSVEHDYLKDGFVAHSRSEELPNPELYVRFLLRTEDVTKRVLGAVKPGMAEAERSAAIDSVMFAVSEEVAHKDSTLVGIVDAYYGGNEFWLSVYRDYNDVRLVFAPPSSVGKFGWDTDNWVWPRHTGDFCVFRIYADRNNRPADYSPENVPYHPEYVAPVSLDGYKEGSFCMTLGYPGRTERYLSSFGIEEMMNNDNQAQIDVRGIKQAIWKREMDRRDSIRIKYASKYDESSNYWKNSIGVNRENYFCKREDGSDFVSAVWPGWTHFPDVLNADARAWFGQKYERLISKGIDGFWNDMNEPAMFCTPEGVAELKEYIKDNFMDNEETSGFVLGAKVKGLANNPEDYKRFYHNVNGQKIRHDKVHNLFGYNMTRAAGEAFEKIAPGKRFLMFSRSSYVGMHRYGGIWMGDNKSWWSHILLNLKMLPSLNMCGFLYTGADLGGFGADTTRDLVLRWLALGVFTPLMRNHSALGTREQEAYQFENIEDFRHVIGVRYRLVPYLYSEYMKAALNDDMMFRPLAFDYTDDTFATQVEDQLLLGNEIMIAPVYTQNAKGRYVYLPEEMMFVKFLPDGTISQEILEKGHHYVEVALNEVPLFIRKGKAIPVADVAQTVKDIDPATIRMIGYEGAEYDRYDDDGVSTL